MDWHRHHRTGGAGCAEDGWVANPIFRFVSRFVIGHHATMDAS